MKRLICVFLILLTLSGCVLRAAVPSGASFYYPRKEISFGREDGVIAMESRDLHNISDPSEILAIYYQGPAASTLANPFPAGLKTVEIKQEDSSLILVLSEEICALSGLSLTEACVCLAKTTMSMTGAESVEIHSQNGSLNIVLTADSTELQDLLPAESIP